MGRNQVETILNPLRSQLALAFLLLFLINIFFDLMIINNILAIITVCLILINLPFLKGINKYVSLFLLSSGIVLLISTGAPLAQWANALTANTGLICLILAVPLLGIPLDFEDFRQALAQSVKKYMDRPQPFYLITTFLSYSLGMLLNLAAITIIYQLLNRVATKYPRSLFLTALTRGYGYCVFWSPNFVSVAVVLHYLELTWFKIAPWGFLFTTISIVIAYLFLKIEYASLIKDSTFPKEAEIPPGDKEETKVLKKLMALGLFLLLLIVFLEYLTGKSVLIIVPLVSVIFPYVVAVLWRKTTVYYNALKHYYKNTLANSKNEIVLFAIAGFFGQALIEAGVGELLTKIINNANIEQGLIYIIAIIVPMVLLSLIGIHPVVSGSTIAVTVPVTSLPLMPIQYALTLLAGWTLAIILSPFSGTVLITSGISQESPYKLGIGWNWRYALILFVIYVLLLSFIPI
jgi:DcuC family C4-dicarboxylate transporter